MLSLGLLSLALAAALFGEDRSLLAGLCLAVFVVLVARVAWVLTDLLRHRASLPRSHSVLTDQLGFRIDFTCRDVAMSSFLFPDTLAAGARTRLLCFVENYSSRQRVAEFRIGPHPQLGLPQACRLSLHLAAGQAAVCVLPLEADPALPPGAHDLPIELTVRLLTGKGSLLPGTRRHLHNLHTVHFATPFTVGEKSGSAELHTTDTANTAPEGIRCLSLGSMAEKEPRLEALQSLLN
jgi:hypothetical protein